MISEIVVTVLNLIIIMIMSIIAHEWGHVRNFKTHGRDVKVRFEKGQLVVGTSKDYRSLSAAQVREIYKAGVITGLAPIILAGLFLEPLSFLLLVPYGLAARDDIKNYMRLNKHDSRTNRRDE